MKKIFILILKNWLKYRDECIGSFWFKGKSTAYTEYGSNADTYQDSLDKLLNSSVNEERWKKSFVKF